MKKERKRKRKRRGRQEKIAEGRKKQEEKVNK